MLIVFKFLSQIIDKMALLLLSLGVKLMDMDTAIKFYLIPKIIYHICFSKFFLTD